jgi:tetratricopeptide (TPR) repeat protein
LIVTFAIILHATIGGVAFAQGNITVFGRVSFPDGNPASRVKVFIEASNGLKREMLSDDQGRYEFRGLGSGRYRVSAVNPEVPEQYSEPAESDTTRTFANRLQIDVYLRLPMQRDKKNHNPGVISATEAAQKIPKAARKAYDQGIKLQKENRSQDALIQFNQAIELYPEYFQALTERANMLMQNNQLPQSEADFARALQIDPKHVPALRGLGYCQIQQKKFPEALGNLEKAFALEPNVPLTLLLLGYANLSLNRYQEAKQSLQQALKIGPENAARARVYLAEVFAHEQKFKEAADEIRAYLRVKPDAADAAGLQKMEADWRARSKGDPKQK